MLRKHGTGEILRDEEQHKQASREDWTEQDQRDLVEEMDQGDDDETDEQGC